ncbi:DUF4070 domain-containing protein [Deferribacter autotrophicus]|uniref:DUF4070 domain-containing protein n=1 Tax=Deferribacter autotrophicus TaxID=500465 RepID=A0A5A8F8X0_9BACT|nr:B12-binding domain-containing radical SAM protein [Deferribacter autotrophicus]KAA0259381.1 DUF4070 domain-containing protein [Deferribacter autotrophicus]
MKALLVYPEYPNTFWSFKYALDFINKKASLPPLGLLTIASMLPEDWSLKLVDLNVSRLTDEHILWADLVIISAMSIQKDSALEIIDRCHKYNVKVAGGGPLFTVESDKFDNVDYLILGEGEITVPKFLNDLKTGVPKNVYMPDDYADMVDSPAPKWEALDDINAYASLSIQYSRGCPFNCDFCNVTSMLGNRVRTKTVKQVITELDNMYNLGWRGGVFFVDDNFIAHKKRVKDELLPTLIKWMKKRKYPFEFFTQVSINLADDDEMIDLMVQAGFDTVFIGIETPNEASLNESKKYQNINRNLMDSVRKLHRKGLQVQGGFIVGFDSDPLDIFDRQINFIQKSGIITAMVGLLNAPPGTKLYERLKSENRLLDIFGGNNTDIFINFIPKIDKEKLVEGYLKIVNTIYSPKKFYERLKTFLKDYNPPDFSNVKFSFKRLKAFFKSLYKLGIFEKERYYFYKLLFWVSLRKFKCLPMAIYLSICGYHFRKVFEEVTEDYFNKGNKF